MTRRTKTKMADSEGGGSWWGGWLQTAKEKSSAALDLVRKDLAEFSSTTINDTAQAATVVKENVKTEKAAEAGSKMKEGFSHLVGGLSRALSTEDDPMSSRKYQSSSAGAVYNRFKSRLISIQVDTGTYLNEPSGPPEKYKEWLETFVFDKMKGDISELLVVNVEVRALYTQLVPGEVSHLDFWQHYFYKVHQLKEDEARKDELKKRAECAEKEADLGWEDEDDWGDITGPASPPREAHFPASMTAKTDLTTPVPSDHDPVETQTKDNDQNNKSPEPQGPAESLDAGESRVEYKSTPEEESSVDKLQDKNTENHEVHKEDDKEIIQANLAAQEKETPALIPETDTKADVPSLSALATGIDASKTTELTIQTENLTKADIEKEVKTKDKGDMVFVGSDRSTPTSTNSNNKESSSIDEDWEKDFDIEVTEEDLRLAQEAAKKIGTTGGKDEEDDWENWD